MTEPTREEIIKALRHIAEISTSKNITCTNAANLIESDSTRIAQLEAENKRLKEERRWIPVSEKQPKHDCLVYESNSKRVLFAYAEELDAADWNVTHWQPLPQPPETESEVKHEN